ncbi:MAG: hypothetical protein NVV62_05795 [Terricaulis sp.]|nr:hypothetical protein [Terricaulis sp.]
MILMAGTLALFVAVIVLGAVVLNRRPRPAHAAEAEAALDLHEREHAPRRRMGLVAVVLGATAAAVLVVMAGAALWRAQGASGEAKIADTPRFAGQVSCALDREASVGAQGGFGHELCRVRRAVRERAHLLCAERRRALSARDRSWARRARLTC